MATIDVQRLAEEYLDESDRLKQRYEAICRRAKGVWGDEGLELRRRMRMYFEMYLECKCTGRYLLRCAQEATRARA